jgi:hypothetical protein
MMMGASQRTAITLGAGPVLASHEGALDHVVARISHMPGLVESPRVQ